MSEDAVQTFASVWDALEGTADEAAHMRLRSELMIAVQSAVQGWRLPQVDAARRLGVTDSRLDDLLRGRVDPFDLDTLVRLTEHAGLAIRLEVTPKAA